MWTAWDSPPDQFDRHLLSLNGVDFGFMRSVDQDKAMLGQLPEMEADAEHIADNLWSPTYTAPLGRDSAVTFPLQKQTFNQSYTDRENLTKRLDEQSRKPCENEGLAHILAIHAHQGRGVRQVLGRLIEALREDYDPILGNNAKPQETVGSSFGRCVQKLRLSAESSSSQPVVCPFLRTEKNGDHDGQWTCEPRKADVNERGSEPDETIVDIVFVNGLMGNHETTWTHKQSKTFWRQSLLARDRPNPRILTCGYDESRMSCRCWNESPRKAGVNARTSALRRHVISHFVPRKVVALGMETTGCVFSIKRGFDTWWPSSAGLMELDKFFPPAMPELDPLLPYSILSRSLLCSTWAVLLFYMHRRDRFQNHVLLWTTLPFVVAGCLWAADGTDFVFRWLFWGVLVAECVSAVGHRIGRQIRKRIYGRELLEDEWEVSKNVAEKVDTEVSEKEMVDLEVGS